MTKRKQRKLSKNQIVRNRSIKYRIYPSSEQAILIEKTFGCCRYIWNQMLYDEQEFYAATDKHFIPTPAKYKKQAPFLSEVDSLALANTHLNLNNAFKDFFNGKGKKGYPKFKTKKRSRSSYTTNCQYMKSGANNKITPSIRFVKGGLHLPKIGDVKASIHRMPLKGWKLKSATISKSKTGKYYCAVLFEYVELNPNMVIPNEETSIGLDYSSQKFYIDDRNFSPEKIRFFRESEDKLAREQRKLSKMKIGSNNYKKQLTRVNHIHEKISNQRKDFAHKESRQIANVYNLVAVENLNLRTMSRTLNLGKSTMDNGFGMFREFLSYKLEEQGKHFVKVDKWFPSTKTCNHCGYINKEIKLSDRRWTCPICGSSLDRDQNAAINIKNEGLRIVMDSFFPTEKAA